MKEGGEKIFLALMSLKGGSVVRGMAARGESTGKNQRGSEILNK